jgi:hypothetical protein
MSEYNPDCWKVIEIELPDGEKLLKVFGTWRGGYTNGDSWRLNSGVSGIEVEGDLIHFYGHSGSTYTVHKDAEGTSGYTSGVLATMIAQAEGKAKILDDYVKNHLQT